MIKFQNLKLVILLKYWNIKTFLQKVTLHIGLKKFLWLKKLKILYCGHVINDLNGEEITGTFYENELQKTNQKEFRIEKVINRKGNKLHVKVELTFKKIYICYLLHWKPFKSDEKCFSFHLKSSFHSQDI